MSSSNVEIPTSTADVHWLADEYLRRVNLRDLDALFALYAPDFRSHAADGTTTGVEETRAVLASFLDAVPDFAATPVRVVAEDDGFAISFIQLLFSSWRQAPLCVRWRVIPNRPSHRKLVVYPLRSNGLRSLPRRGGRVKVVRAHVRRVVKCLDAAEARIDVEGNQALPALVVLLDDVADRYADGRLGALLDEEKLTEYSAGRDW
ncbi:nuclear transport factor 2 family protein [Streptomyces sporangiiformans]|nr:nuclear transport factor 2 family protein [Streptomyces sporangiiformans]